VSAACVTSWPHQETSAPLRPRHAKAAVAGSPQCGIRATPRGFYVPEAWRIR
jgi:hypothetical protein